MANWPYHELHPHVALGREQQATVGDAIHYAARQRSTAVEILNRLSTQPGVILADEVGMGKTYVALAVAVSVIFSQRSQRRQPVVVMTPSGLQKKWRRDFEKFCDCYFEGTLSEIALLKARVRCVDDGEDLFHALDLPADERPWLILISHGALNRRLKDEWLKLALMRRALLHQPDASALRRKVEKCASRLLQMQGETRRTQSGEAIWRDLLDTPPSGWKKHLIAEGLLHETAPDPVPESLLDQLKAADMVELREAIRKLPQRIGADSFKERLDGQKKELNDALQKVWKQVLTRQQHRLPLLILDEAHHAKNEDTGLATMLSYKVSREDADDIKQGALAGKFERMLFLTATPFQLGHDELCQVLGRFAGTLLPMAKSLREEFAAEIATLRAALDASQHQAQLFEKIWAANCPATLPPDTWRDIQEVQAALSITEARFETAQALLRKWVIRHLKPRALSASLPDVLRRQRHTGDAIHGGSGAQGIEVQGAAVLPFLLASRAALMNPDARPVFAEGLASSYEAFRHTREEKETSHDDEEKGDAAPHEAADRATAWYLSRLDAALPLHDPSASAAHPKIAATVRRAVELWEQGEKVVVFSHFRKTGHKLRQLISREIRQRIDVRHTPESLDRLSRRFDDAKSPARHACDAEVRRLLQFRPTLTEHVEDLIRIARRFLSTPSYLARCLPAEITHLDEDTVTTAFRHRDVSGLSFEQVLEQFFTFLSSEKQDQRTPVIEALLHVQIGQASVENLDADDLQGAARESVEPNVRLVNGSTTLESRERLMLTFNSPFFPEILITSSVMAEGVDLHRFCRHVIHHDLAWNPSTLEQRTGRVDRIECKAEQLGCGKPIQVYLPYLAATQDEKQYQVVTYRERWFGILMGEDYRADSLTTERLSSRLPLPTEIVDKLTLDLSV